MTFNIDVFEEEFPIAGRFVISRGAKTVAHVVRVVISDGTSRGHGECVPYARYGESIASVVAQIEEMRPLLMKGMTREALLGAMKAGAGRNAIDCAIWDFEAKKTGRSAFSIAGVEAHAPVTTAYTLSLGTPESMAEAARLASARPLLKIKVGGEGDIERLRAVRGAAPNSAIIVDANEGWTTANLEENLAHCAALNVAMVEQPLPAGQDEALARVAHPVLVFADESVHQSGDLAKLADRYDGVNIKLDKAGGLTEALKMHAIAKSIGLKTMIGCMVGSSLGMAPALALAQSADFVDLDGPLLLSKDRDPALRYDGSLVFAPTPDLWG
jgi:L-alanine-DL-glutamate epimerase-like enolase superfamily enzyme